MSEKVSHELWRITFSDVYEARLMLRRLGIVDGGYAVGGHGIEVRERKTSFPPNVPSLAGRGFAYVFAACLEPERHRLVAGRRKPDGLEIARLHYRICRP